MTLVTFVTFVTFCDFLTLIKIKIVSIFSTALKNISSALKNIFGSAEKNMRVLIFARPAEQTALKAKNLAKM